MKKTLLTALSSLLIGFMVIQSVAAYSSSDTDFSRAQSPVQSPDSYDETPQSVIDAGVCEGRQHTYTFTNTSSNTARYKYWSAINGFAVIFDTNYTTAEEGTPATDDFLTNVDTSTLLCMDGAGSDVDGDGAYDAVYEDCSFDVDDLGVEVYSGSEWGGTTVTYEEMDFISGSPRGLLWQYGQDSGTTNMDLPWIESGETWYAGAVSFDAIDYTEYRTATTEAWIFVEYWKQDTKNTSSTSDDVWTKTYSIEVDSNRDGNPDNSTWDPDGDHEWWWGILDVNRSIWPACDAPAATCQSLELTPDASSISVDDLDGSPIDFNATVTDTEGTDITRESDINWMAFDYQASQPDFSDTPDANGVFRYGIRDMFGRSNDVTTDAEKEVSYYNAESGDWILGKVDGTDAAPLLY